VDQKVPKNTRISRSGRTGEVVARKVEDGKRGEVWEISDPNGGRSRTGIVSSSTAAALDRITKKHSAALKRLATK